jgi:hypothetical protein
VGKVGWVDEYELCGLGWFFRSRVQTSPITSLTVPSSPTKSEAVQKHESHSSAALLPTLFVCSAILSKDNPPACHRLRSDRGPPENLLPELMG